MVGATGPPARRSFELVELADLRWVFLSNDRPEQVSGPRRVLAARSAGAVVTTWLNRQVLAAGGTSSCPSGAGTGSPRATCSTPATAPSSSSGRRCTSCRPPSDCSTRALRCCGAPSAGRRRSPAPRPCSTTHLDAWRDSFVSFHHWLCPWVHAVEPGWWRRAVDRVAHRELAAIVPAYGPVLCGRFVAMAIEALRELPMLPPTPPGGTFDQHHDAGAG